MGEAKHVYVAINEVVAAISKDGIAKNRSNQQQGYKFRGIDDLYNALSGILAKAKLLILPRVLHRSITERETKSGGVMSYVVLDIEFDLVSAVDGSTHTIRTMGEAMDSADKATNKAQSAAMKYACLMAFQIPTEADNDADAYTPEPAPRRPPPAKPPTPQEQNVVDQAVQAVTERIEASNDVKELTAIYAEIQKSGLPDHLIKHLVSCLSARRRQLEGRAA